MSWNRCGSCATTPIAARSDVCVTSRTSCPSMRTAPDVTSYSLGIRLLIVVLPPPDGPTSATSCPGSMRGGDAAQHERARRVGQRPAAGRIRLERRDRDLRGRRVAEPDVVELDAAARSTRSIAPGASTIAFGVSSTSNTRSNETNALMMSTRAFVSAVSGPYTRVTYVASATIVPSVIAPEITRWPPTR